MVISRSPTYAVLSLCIGIVALAGLFVLLNAHFVAMIQVLIYAGAILVLFLFVIMLLGVKTEAAQAHSSFPSKIRNLSLTLAFFAEISLVFVAASKNWVSHTDAVSGTVENIGRVLLSKYFLPFEFISMILLIGIIGVISLAQKETKSHDPA